MRRFAESSQASHGTLGINLITCLNSIATGVLWNGLGFVTAREFHYSATETFTLYIVTGIVYAVTALSCGRIIRGFEHRFQPRTALLLILSIQALVAPLIYAGSSSVGLIIIAVVLSITGATLWPIVESYVGAGRTADETRKSIGNWCIVWTSSVTLTLFLMAPLLRADGWLNPRLALFAIAPLSLLSIACLWLVPKQPGHHHAMPESAPAAYAAQLKSVRVLLPASYLLVGALSPLMPYLLTRLDLEPTTETPLTATWLLTRVVAVAVMVRASFWHGRAATLFVGAAALAGGFALVVAVPTLPNIVIGLSLFGIGHGIIYYAALYYALRVGSSDIQSGGIHEALIGLGYVVGPAAGLAGVLLGGGTATVAIVWALLALAAIPAAIPLWKERARSAGKKDVEAHSRG